MNFSDLINNGRGISLCAGRYCNELDVTPQTLNN